MYIYEIDMIGLVFIMVEIVDSLFLCQVILKIRILSLLNILLIIEKQKYIIFYIYFQFILQKFHSFLKLH